MSHESNLTCPNCEGRGHEGTGEFENDYPCRVCVGAKTVPSCGYCNGLEIVNGHCQDCGWADDEADE